MPQVTLPLTLFQTPDGNPVSFGVVRIRLNTNGNASGNQLGSSFVDINLNINGALSSNPLFWTNSSILPDGTYYIIQVFTQSGQLVYGPSKLTI